jgi:hypothetical protein
MRRLRKILILFMSIATVVVLPEAASAQKDKDKGGFTPGPASSFENKQTIADVTVAAKAFETDSDARQAFGKLNPYEHGILPVLVVIQNDTKQPIKLDRMQVQYVMPDRSRIDATPAQEVQYTRGPDRPNMNPRPLPIPRRAKKNPLAAFEIEGRAFAAKMLLPGESAHGFFYFQTRHRSGSQIYISGLSEAATGKELFFFEIPLTQVNR